MYNLATSLLLPVLNLHWPRVSANGFKNIYLGDAKLTGLNWGKYLFLQFNKHKIHPEYKEVLKEHEMFDKHYYDEDNIIFVFLLNEKDQRDIIEGPT